MRWNHLGGWKVAMLSLVAMSDLGATEAKLVRYASSGAIGAFMAPTGAFESIAGSTD
jgi:hypothetical protein